MKFNLIIIFTFIAFISCQKRNQLNTIISELPAFDTIELDSPFDLFLIEDSTFSIEITGYERNLENLNYSVDNHTLRIINNTKNTFATPTKNKIEIYLTSNKLSQIKANETCNISTVNPITSDNFGLIFKSKINNATLELNCGTFYYWNDSPCGGVLTLKGKSEMLKLWNYALMAVDAKKLLTKRALIENHSKGCCKVNVQDKIEYSIDGIGDIHLYGSPSEIIKNELTSSGRLIIHD